MSNQVLFYNKIALCPAEAGPARLKGRPELAGEKISLLLPEKLKYRKKPRKMPENNTDGVALKLQVKPGAGFCIAAGAANRDNILLTRRL